MDNWPFREPQNAPVFTVQQIMDGIQPILHVSHDEEDGGWQFLAMETLGDMDPVIVEFGEIVKIDQAILELADLPLGWRANRKTPNEPWQREQIPYGDK